MKSRLKTLLILVGLSLVGSFINFYAVNLVMNAVANKETEHFFDGFFTAFPMFFAALSFVLATIYVLRLYLHPTHKKKQTMVYGIILASFSFLGILFVILSGTVVYHSMTKPYPFAGYHILCLIWHILTLALGLLMIFYIPKKIKDPDIILSHLDIKRTLISILLAFTIFYAYNRFGAFLWSPTYISWLTLSDTYPFYLSLLLLIGLLLHMLFYTLNYYKEHSIGGIAISSALIVLSLFFFVQIVVRGREDPAFVAAISPAVPIERLLAFPYDTILNAVMVIALGAFTLNHSILFKRLKDEEVRKYS
ncbi:MAG: hypothetical protein MJ207_00550 [Bacilli bacterium]|nr:hypothetical protein [Bacilli bacterium]